MKVSISYADIDPLKSQLLALAPGVKASHRVEALARGLGFGSHAALLVAVGERPAPCAIDDCAFGAFLKGRGGGDLPYDTLSEAVVRTKFADSRAAIAEVLAGEPALSANGMRTHDRRLSPAENVADFHRSREEMLEAQCVEQFVRAVAYLATRQKSKTVSRGAVHVAINPTDRADDFIRTHNAGYVAGDAFASGWLERKLGSWLQTPANPTGSVRIALLDRIIAAQPNPRGFADAGRTML